MTMCWNKHLFHYPISLMLIAGVVLFSCAAPHEQTVLVAAASNLAYLFPELKNKFEASHAGIKIEVSFGSSGKLATQILKGAPFDLYLSANRAFPEKLYNEGFSDKAPVVYALGKLVLFKKDGGLDASDSTVLLADQNTIVAITNPETAPYGTAAFQYLETIHMVIPKERLLVAENVGMTVHYALNGADAGFIPMSALYSQEFENNNKKASFLTLPRDAYEPVVQAMIVCRNGSAKNEAAALAAFILSAPGQRIFSEYGYEGGDTDAGY